MAPPPNLDDLLARRIFPGMSARESRILRSWIVNHGAEWDELDVEPRVGAGVLLPPHFDEKFRADWERRTRARPDCIAKRAPDVVLIVEAKELATSEAIWQVNGYRDLYRAEFPSARISTLVICEAAHGTAKAVAVSQQVQIIQYLIPEEAPLAPGAEAPPA
jgi:hypothetical protein